MNKISEKPDIIVYASQKGSSKISDTCFPI